MPALIDKVRRAVAEMRQVASSAILGEHIQERTNRHLALLQNTPRYRENTRLLRHGLHLFSQNDEDGIIEEIFNRIGTTNTFFLEFGVGSGFENNTLYLLMKGWRGVWIESNIKCVKKIRRNLKRFMREDRLNLHHNIVQCDNINNIIENSILPSEIDLLSVDIDGNDYHVISSISATSPRVIIAEYNAKFGPTMEWIMSYDPTHEWVYGDYFGASLKSYELLLSGMGYSLVGCNITGANSFFVRNDCLNDKFFEPFDSENHYEPARYWMTRGWRSGWPTDKRTVDCAARRMDERGISETC